MVHAVNKGRARLHAPFEPGETREAVVGVGRRLVDSAFREDVDLGDE